MARSGTSQLAHVTAFCKAVLCGCATDEPWLASLCNHHLSLDALFSHAQDEAFKAMCLQGWSWTVVSQSVEVAIPELPILVQAVSLQQSETEVLQTVAHLYQMASTQGGAPNLKACLDQVAAAKSKCLDYLDTINHYLTKFGGGPEFPCVTMLQHVDWPKKTKTTNKMAIPPRRSQPKGSATTGTTTSRANRSCQR